MTSITNPIEKETTKIEWEYAATIERSSMWVQNIASALGFGNEQLDHLFVTAATL